MSPKNPFETRRITIEDLKSEKRQRELDWRDKVRYQREAILDSSKIETAHVSQGVGEIAHVLEVKNDGNDQRKYNHLWSGKDGFLYKNKREEKEHKQKIRFAYEGVFLNREKTEKAIDRLFHDIFLGYAGFSQKVIDSISIDKKRDILEKIINNMDSEISDSEFKKFIETGKISNSTIRQIASVIFSKERDLSPREKQITNTESLEISKIIDEMKLEESKTRKEDRSAEEKKAILNDLGWSENELANFTEDDKVLIVEKKLKRSSFRRDDILMKQLGYSLNQIIFIVSEDDREKILSEKLSPEDWLKFSREKNASYLEKSTDVSLKRKPFSQWLDSTSSGPVKEVEINIISQIINLGWSVKEAKGMSSEKAGFVLKNSIKKEDWSKWEKEFNLNIDRGVVSGSKEGGPLYKEKSGMVSFSDNQDKFNLRVKEKKGNGFNIEQKINELEDELELLRKVRSKLVSPNGSNLNNIDNSYLEGQTVDSIDEKIKSRKEDIKYLESYFTEKESEKVEAQSVQPSKESGKTKEEPKKEDPEEITPRTIEREIIIENLPPGAEVSITKEVLSGDEAAEFVRKEGPQDGDDVDTKIFKIEAALKNFESLKDPKVKLVLFEFRNKLANLRKEKERIDVLKKEYEKNEKELSSLGWDFESYSKLSEFNKSFIVFNKITRDDFEGKKESKEEKVSTVAESAEPTVVLIEQPVEERQRIGVVEDAKYEIVPGNTGVKEVEAETNTQIEKKQEGLTAESFAEHVLRNTKDGVLDKGAITQEQLDFYKKNKAEVKRLIEEKTGKFQTRSVSPGAQEFVKNERVAVEKERGVVNEMSLLEKGYENLNKEELGRIAKEKGLSSNGEKQAIIDRITRFDAENGTKEFGWVKDPGIKEKLKEFNMSEKDMLLASPEFFELTPEKQRYLFSKIEQKIYLDAEFSAKDRNEQEINQMGFLKRAVASFGKDQRKVALRDKIIGEIKSGGITDYKDDISVLGQYLKEAPDLRYIPNEKGKLVPVFEFTDTTSLNKKFETPKAFFNMAASRFAEIPYEWSLDSANSTQKDAYIRARESYVSAKDALVRATVEEAEFSNKGISKEEMLYKKQEAMAKVLGFDAKINFGRYVTQNPEMEKITSNFTERVLGTSVNDFVRGKMFFAAGYLTRAASRTMAATVVGLAASAAIGGYMGYRKKNLEFTEKELRKRYGSEVKELAIKRVANSGNVYGRIEKLVTQFEKTKDENSRARILETIKTRIFVTEEMLRDGRLNFGNKKEQVFNQYKLSQLMSEASVLVAMNGGFNEQKTSEEEVFERFKDFVQDDASESEKDKEKRLAALRGAAFGAVGFGIGSGIRYLQDEGYMGAALKAVSENAKNAFESAKNLAGDGVGFIKDKITPPSEIEVSADKISPEIKTTPEEILKSGESVTFATASVEVGRRGAIGAIDDLQEAIKSNITNSGDLEKYAEFLSKDPHDLAREWGFYKPGEESESAIILKGAKFELTSEGNISYVDSNGVSRNVMNLSGEDASRFEGKFFDAGKGGSASYENVINEKLSIAGAEKVPGAKDSNFDFEAYKKAKIEEGWEYSGKSGDKFTYNVGEKENLPAERGSSVKVDKISSGEDFVPNKPSVETAIPKESAESLKIGGKEFKLNIEKDSFGRVYVPMNTVIDWDLGLDNVSRKEFLTSSLNRNILEQYGGNYKFGLDFDRLLVAEKMINSGGVPTESDEYKALQNFIFEEKQRLSNKYGENLFIENNSSKVSSVAESVPKTKIAGPEFVSSGDDVVNQSSKKFLNMAAKYGTPKVDKDIVVFGDKYVGFYDESLSESGSMQKISAMARENKLIAPVDKYVEFVNGKYQTMIIYKIIK